MQNRMKNHQLTNEQIDQLLNKCMIGHLGCIDDEKRPYVLPVNFIYLNKKIYIHGLLKGKKMDCISKNPHVCFQAEENKGLVKEGNGPCHTNMLYESVIVQGTIKMVDEFDEKNNVLREIVTKYTPELLDFSIPESAIKATAVLEISINEITGKYYSGKGE